MSLNTLTPQLPAPLALDIADLPKGIDNYHIDIKLSDNFIKHVRQLIDHLLKLETGQAQESDREKLFNPLRHSYQDMMSVLLHRLKTDLEPRAVELLQFAAPKLILQHSNRALREHINQTKLKAADLRERGSSQVLGVHQHLAWLTRHFNAILYRMNKQMFDQLQRVEQRVLRSLRAQLMPPEAIDFAALLGNPLLLNRDLSSPLFLLEHYVYWDGSSDESSFPTLNQDIEEQLDGLFADHPLQPLKPPPAEPPPPSEVFDELGGLHAIRPYLGIAEDSKYQPAESWCWLDEPGNLQTCFDLDALSERAAELGKQGGRGAARALKQDIKHLRRTLSSVHKLLEQRQLFPLLVASYRCRELLGKTIHGEADPRQLCLFLAGQLPRKRLTAPLPGQRTLSSQELDSLDLELRNLTRERKQRPLELTARILRDLARFRHDLKAFRFTHRLFNRLHLLERQEHIKLSRQANTLFLMPTAGEVESEERRIAHHAIMKADLRGSTTVTRLLEEKGLNAASHFSLRFFNPINQLLPVFGAEKVFIEGDAIILSFLEYAASPQEWFSVSQACGLACALLGVIDANNRHARQLGLPPLETGIGICYADESPRFLFDGDRPIMISSAIGHADRMSSSSWKLRACLRPDPFNVEVLEIAEGEREHGEKGQQFMRYNVNGVLLDDAAFRKLSGEIRLQRLNALIEGRKVALLCGEFPDQEGRTRGLVIREGRIGLWRDGQAQPGGDERPPYYEVVSNPRILSQVRKALGRDAEGGDSRPRARQEAPE